MQLLGYMLGYNNEQVFKSTFIFRTKFDKQFIDNVIGMPEITITVNGIEGLLNGLNPNKFSLLKGTLG